MRGSVHGYGSGCRARRYGDPSVNPIQDFLDHQGYMVLDGGLATTLEAYGCDLDDPLWSAKVLLEQPDIVAAVHRDFLAAGADCIATVTYQATFAGLAARGIAGDDARGLLATAVDLACDARDEFWENRDDRTGRLRPIVAASVGPYGA